MNKGDKPLHGAGKRVVPSDWKARAHLRTRGKKGRGAGRRGRIDLGAVVWSIVHRVIPDEALRLERLRAAWEEVATSRVAARTWPSIIRHNKLFVDVSDNQWMHELHYGKATLLERIRTLCPVARIQEVRFGLGAVPTRDNRPSTATVATVSEGSPWRQAPLDGDPPPETMQALLQISDPTLRQLAANARLALGQSRR